MILVPLILALLGVIVAIALIVKGSHGRAIVSMEPAGLRLRLAADPATLDPARASDSASLAVVSQIFDGLVGLDPASGAVVPALASSWEISRDGTAYTFHLQPAAKFHDGRDVTADDVVYSFERLLSSRLRSERRFILANVVGAEAYSSDRAPRVEGLRTLDPHTLRINLISAYSPFLSLLALQAASVIPRGTPLDSGGAAEPDPVGAGPFRLASRERGSRIVLLPHRGFYGAPAAVPRVTYRIIPSSADAIEEYLAGNIDVLGEVPRGTRDDAVLARADQLRRVAQSDVAFVAFNHARAPFQGNKPLRQALNYAVDREALCRAIADGREIPAAGILPPGVAGSPRPDAGEDRGFPYDPGKARALLAKAGFPGGRGLPNLALGYNAGELNRLVVERIQSDLAAIGVKVTLREFDSRGLMEAILGDPDKGSDLHMVRMSWHADYPDPDAFLTPTLHSTSMPFMGNYGRYASPTFDGLVDRARITSDPSLRARLYREAESVAVDDAAWLFLYYSGDETLVQPYVKDLVLPGFGDLLAPLDRVRLDPPPLQAKM